METKILQEIVLNKGAEEIIGEPRFSSWTDELLGAMIFKTCSKVKGEQHLHMLAASIVGTNKVSDSMSQFFPQVKMGK